MSLIASHLVFLSQQETTFVFDTLFALSRAKKAPDLRRRSTFRNKPMLNALATRFIKEGMSISKHLFDLYPEEKLVLTLQSEMPLDFDRDSIKAFYDGCGLEVYFFTKDTDGNFLLSNLLSGKELVITSDPELFNRFMPEVTDFWEIIYASTFKNDIARLTDEAKTVYILALLENIIVYAGLQICKKEYCHYK